MAVYVVDAPSLPVVVYCTLVRKVTPLALPVAPATAVNVVLEPSVAVVVIVTLDPPISLARLAAADADDSADAAEAADADDRDAAAAALLDDATEALLMEASRTTWGSSIMAMTVGVAKHRYMLRVGDPFH